MRRPARVECGGSRRDSATGKVGRELPRLTAYDDVVDVDGVPVGAPDLDPHQRTATGMGVLQLVVAVGVLDAPLEESDHHRHQVGPGGSERVALATAFAGLLVGG